MTTYQTAKLKLPVPNDDDPYQLGARRIRELGEALDASTGTAWVNITLVAGWTTQATFPVPQYRVVGGMCQLRGAVRRSDNTIPGTTVFASAMPGPAGVNAASAPTAVMLSAVAADAAAPNASPGGRVLVNPRYNGNVNILNTQSPANVNLVYLDGLAYSVA